VLTKANGDKFEGEFRNGKGIGNSIYRY